MANADEAFERFFRESICDKLVELLEVRGDIVDLVKEGADILMVYLVLSDYFLECMNNRIS
jgi:hypothetical protein